MTLKYLVTLGLMVSIIIVSQGQKTFGDLFSPAWETRRFLGLFDSGPTNKHFKSPMTQAPRSTLASESSDSLLRGRLAQVRRQLDHPRAGISVATSRSATSRLDSSYVFSPDDMDHPSEIIYYSYNEAGLLTVSRSHFEQQNDTRILYFYGEDQRVIHEIKQHQDGSQWNNVSMIEYSYENLTHQLKQVTLFHWDWTYLTWDADYLYDISYDEQGRMRQKHLYLITAEGDLLDLHFRYVYLYDNFDRRSEGVEQFKCLGASGPWYNSRKTHFIYGPNDKLAETRQYFWSVDHWEQRGEGIDYSYDINDQLTEERMYELVPSGPLEWRNTYRDSFLYSADQQEIQLLTSVWGSQQENWIPQLITDSFFNAKGFVDSLVQYSTCAGDYSPKRLETFHYDSTNILTEQFFHSWDGMSQAWVCNFKMLYLEENGLLSSRTLSYWDEMLQQWKKDYRRVYLYDSYNRIAEVIYQIWFSDSWTTTKVDLYTYNNGLLAQKQMGAHWRVHYAYDADHRLTKALTSVKKLIGGAYVWTPYDRQVLTYNEHDQEVLSQLYHFDPSDNNWLAQQKIQTYYADGTGLVNQKIYEFPYPTEMTESLIQKKRHFWSTGAVTGTEAVPETTLSPCLMPNPLRGDDWIHCDQWPENESGQLYLIDMLGRVRLQQVFSNPLRLSTDHLGSGVYVLMIRKEGGGLVFSKKVVVE